MSETLKRHGGRREGAGRKPAPEGSQRIYITVRVAPATYQALKALEVGDEGLGRVIDRLIAERPPKPD